MASYGFQLSLEMTNLIPVRNLALSAFTKALEYARELRRSGSDIVVEADLAMIFGPVKIRPEMEKAFREVIKTNAFVQILPESDLGLAIGPGPTVSNAIRDRALLSTVIQLSMLAYFCNRQDLADMIGNAMNERVKARIRDSSPDPGTDGIANTLKACSSQCSAFEWHVLRNKALEHLRSCIPGYELNMDRLVKISSSMILALMDMLMIVQSLPEDRRITISNDTGCLIILLWAHYIAGLTVCVVTKTGQEAKFGSMENPQVVILSELQAEHHLEELGDPIIRLHEKNESIIFECQPSPKFKISASIQERHSLAGYGTEVLRRRLNTYSVTPSDDPIFEEAKILVTAMAIRQSTRLSRCMPVRRYERDQEEIFTIELWRIQDAARLLFEGDNGCDTLDMRKVEVYLQNPILQEPLKEGNLPISFDRLALKQVGGQRSSVKSWLLGTIKGLIQTLLYLSCVHDIRSCSLVPLILPTYMGTGLKGEYHTMYEQTVFHGIADLLVGSTANDTFNYGNDFGRHIQQRLVSLYSDFGWSIFLDTYSGKDPSATRREIFHLRQGTPVKESTGERRHRIRDGILYRRGSPKSRAFERGGVYLPRCTAIVTKQAEDWVTRGDEFEFATYLTIKGSSEWSNNSNRGSETWEEHLSFRLMYNALWNCVTTPACHCTKVTPKQVSLNSDQVAKLGLSAATFIGWRCPPNDQESAEKILIILTRGNSAIRWAALTCQVGEIWSNTCHREILLVSDECCEECALLYASSLNGYWAMIL